MIIGHLPVAPEINDYFRGNDLSVESFERDFLAYVHHTTNIARVSNVLVRHYGISWDSGLWKTIRAEITQDQYFTTLMDYLSE